MPGSALEAVAGSRSRVLGRDRSPGRSSGSLQGLTSPPLSHPGIVFDVPGRPTSGSGLVARGRGDACQRSLGNRSQSGSWLLQPLFLVEKAFGDWRPVIDLSHLNELVQLTLFKMETVSSVLLSVRGGFSSFPGSEGCVLSDPNPFILEEAIEVHVRGDSLPVLLPVFWTVDRSPGLYQGLRNRVSVGSLARDPSSSVPGRLVGSCLLGAGRQAGGEVPARALSHLQDCDKREEL